MPEGPTVRLPAAAPDTLDDLREDDEPAADADDEDPEDGDKEGSVGRLRLPVVRRPRVSVAGAVIGALLGLLGFALVVQLRSNASDPQLASARTEDLVRILSDLDSRKDRLSQEIASLETTQQQLAAGSEGRSAALAEATRRAQELGILAGTLPAQGPGMTVRFIPGNQPLKAWLILDAVEELRGAGAEAMQISGSSGGPVRIVASTYFTDSGTGLAVDGQAMAPPYAVTVIGDPQTMQPALNIAGGVADTVHQANGTVSVEQGTVRVTAIHVVTTPRYAKPAS
ncbi:MAG TPA: DUF881 domain-containing protein [Rugosimonospora sp.]|nr:DUF881 domain-containing protein [Rugosimonospora sp.]